MRRSLRYFLLLALVFNFLLPQLGALSLSVCPGRSYSTLTSTLIGNAILPLSRSALPPILCCGRYLSRKELSAAKRPVGAMRSASPGFIVTVVMHRSYASQPSGHRHRGIFYNYDSVGVLLISVSPSLYSPSRHLNFPLTRRKGTRAHSPRALPAGASAPTLCIRCSSSYVRSIPRHQHASPATPFSPCRC